MRIDPLGLIFQNYLNTCKPKFRSHWRVILLNFSVLTCERASYIFLFLNELNLTYQRLTCFVVSFNFIPIVLMPCSRFSLCYTLIKPLLVFRDQISILIESYMTMRSQSSHQLVSKLGFENRSYLFEIFIFLVLVKFSVFASIFFFFFVSEA